MGIVFIPLTLHWHLETSTRKVPYLLTLHWKISLTIAASSGITHFVWKSVVMIIVIFANHLAYLKRFFSNSSSSRSYSGIWWALQAILWCVWYKNNWNKPTVLHWQNVLGVPKLFPLLSVFSMYAVYHLWSNVKNAACGAFCILQESCLLLHNRSWWPYWMTTHLHVGQLSVIWNSQVA